MSELPSLPPPLPRRLGRVLFPGVNEPPRPAPRGFRAQLGRWLSRGVHGVMLLLALVNLVLVLFDFSYLELRHHLLRVAPALVSLYDPVKGIEPHRTTANYVARATETFDLLAEDPASPAARAALQEMRARSLTMLHEDPFSGAGLSGVFEQYKNRLRKHTRLESAKQAMAHFWSPENLSPDRLSAERLYFEYKLRPLLDRNYYRGIGENGRPFDAFWLIDVCFVPFFALEFLVRGGIGVRSRRYPSWKAYGLAHWYDLVYAVPLGAYLVPFATQGPLQLVRMISVGYRLQRLGLINPMPQFERQTTRALALVTDLVNVKLLSNYQESIRAFDAHATLQSLTPAQRARLAHVVERNATMLVTQVVPAIAPELRALVTRSARQALEGSQAYQALKQLPLVGAATEQFLPALVSEVLDGTQASLAKAMTDAETKRLLEATLAKLSDRLFAELAHNGTEEEIKRLLIDALEEQKTRLLT